MGSLGCGVGKNKQFPVTVPCLEPRSSVILTDFYRHCPPMTWVAPTWTRPNGKSKPGMLVAPRSIGLFTCKRAPSSCPISLHLLISHLLSSAQLAFLWVSSCLCPLSCSWPQLPLAKQPTWTRRKLQVLALAPLYLSTFKPVRRYMPVDKFFASRNTTMKADAFERAHPNRSSTLPCCY